MSARRGVHLTGTRQCGKTTLAEYISAGTMHHVTLDDSACLQSAMSSPTEFVDRPDGKTLVIDEIQKAPGLLDAIKIKLDHCNDRGQYLLTGSSNLRFMKSVKDSLAGRLKTVRLRTLTQGEIVGGKGLFLEGSFDNEFVRGSRLNKRDVIHLAFCGGYPESRTMDAVDRREWFEDYVSDLLLKDIQDITEIRKVDSLRKVVDWLLAYSSKFFNTNELCAKVQLSASAVNSYLEALRTLYLVDVVAPWAKSDYAKLGKREKRYVADPGLMANLLGWNEDRTFYDDDANGKLVETWVYHELAALVDLSPGYALTQYRDSDKREIDFLIERDDGATLGIEVKAGNANLADFKHLKWFAEHLAQGTFTGIVLHSGSEVLPFGKNLYAVPFSALTV